MVTNSWKIFVLTSCEPATLGRVYADLIYWEGEEVVDFLQDVVQEYYFADGEDYEFLTAALNEMKDLLEKHGEDPFS